MRSPQVSYSTRSDVGRVRRNNEDNLFCCGEFMSEETRNLPFKMTGEIIAPTVFAVCDGMGGYQSGEQASLIAVKVLSEFACRLIESPVDQLDDLMKTYVTDTNIAIQQAIVDRSTKMGTTLALVIVLCDEIHAYNIGDSRVYALDKHNFRQISVDHTLSMMKIKTGEYTEAQARQSDDWHKLTACLGFLDDEGNDYFCEVATPLKIAKKTRLLLCSDGLTDMLTDDSIERVLRSSKKTEQAAGNLISEALNNGGIDNVTLIVIDVG